MSKKIVSNKGLRRPPVSNLDGWVKSGGAVEQRADAAQKVVADERSASVIGLGPAPPEGKGIVKRADGSYKRRLVVYVDPEHGRKLKTAAAMQGLDMSDIVDRLIGQYLQQP